MISFLPVNICHFNKMLFNKKTYHFYFISIVLFYCLHYFGWKCQQLLSALVHFIKVSDITLISETFSYLSHVTFPYFTSAAWILWKLVSATGYFFKGNCNISQFRTHNLKFLKRLYCKNKSNFFYTITFWFHGRNEMLTEKEQLAFIRDYTRTFTVRLGWIWASVLLVQHQFKRCFAEVKNCGTTLFLWMF